MYGVPDLDWTPIDHFETFAGEKAVTMGEKQAHRPLKARHVNHQPQVIIPVLEEG